MMKVQAENVITLFAMTVPRGLMYFADWTRGLDSRTELETTFKQ